MELRCTRLPARIENLPRLVNPVVEAAKNLCIAEDRCHDLKLAVEESLADDITMMVIRFLG